MAVNRKRNIYMTATEAAMYMAEALRSCGVCVLIDDPGKAREAYDRTVRNGSADVKFSVGEMMKLNYVWNGDEVSLKTFAMAFSDLIKVKDRTLEDADRIAKAFLDAVKQNPEAFVPKLKAENMSHARYFILNDGSVFSKMHPMYNSPEYQTQRVLAAIYENVLGDDGFSRFLGLLDPSRVRTPEENDEFLAMERKVSGSNLMQRSLEVNADAVNESRVKGIRNLVQYFENNPDYTYPEKAVIVKGASQWGVVEKKQGDANEVRVVRMTDSNDLAVPVIGGEAAAVVEGLRKGMNFKDALKNGREMLAQNGKRSVPGTYTGWKVYRKSDREEDAAVLQNDAAGTGWCTGGSLGTARSHLSGGDFHIYFEAGEPLIAIRTNNGMMAEPPRGAHEGQFCTEREEQIAFNYIKSRSDIKAGADYVADIEDIRRIMSDDATFEDAFMFRPNRRYENGEFGGDTRSWGKAVEERIKSLLSSRSDNWRHENGYYFSEEIRRFDSSFVNVLFIRGDLKVNKNVSFLALQGVGGDVYVGEYVQLNAPALQSVGGDVDVRNGAQFEASALQSVGRDVSVWKGTQLDVPALQSVGGDVFVWEGVQLNASALQSVGGFMEVWEGAQFNAPALQSVGGYMLVRNGVQLDAPALQSVGGHVNVSKGAQLVAPALQNVGSDVTVGRGARLDAPVLQSVGRHMDVYKGAKLYIPALQSVSGYVHVWELAKLDASVLQNVGGDVTVGRGARLDAPVLQSVNGHVDVKQNSQLDVPALQSVGGDVDVQEGAKLDVPVLQSVGGSVDVQKGAMLDVPVLQSVGRNVFVLENVQLNTPALQNVGRNVEVLPNAQLDAPALQSVSGNVEVWYNVQLDAPALQSVGGSVSVWKGAKLDVPALQSVNGHVDVKQNSQLDVPALQSVGGDVDVREDAQLDVPALQSVGGSVEVQKGAKLDVSALQVVYGNVYVRKGALLDVSALQSVGGDVDVSEGAKLDAPVLQSVSRDVFVQDNAKLDVPALQSVGGYVAVLKGAKLDAPALQSMGRDMNVGKGTRLDVPALQSVGEDVSVREGAQLVAPALQNVGGYVAVLKGAQLDAPALQSVGEDVSVREGAQLVAPVLQSVGRYVNVCEGALLDAPLLRQRDSVSFSMSDGTIYGYAMDGVIHLTPEGINPNTPIHEYAHLWLAAYRQNKPEDWNRLVTKIEESGLSRLVEDNPMYSYLKGNREALAEEAICQMAGDNGERLLLALYQDGDKAHQLADRFRRFVNSYAVKEVFHAVGLKDDILNVNVNILRGYTEGIGKRQSVSAKNECETNSSVLQRFDLTRIKSGPKLS